VGCEPLRCMVGFGTVGMDASTTLCVLYVSAAAEPSECGRTVNAGVLVHTLNVCAAFTRHLWYVE
jgi:hypothetical protein